MVVVTTGPEAYRRKVVTQQPTAPEPRRTVAVFATTHDDGRTEANPGPAQSIAAASAEILRMGDSR
jgi:hypothetical protein